jgi:hypothetical protein
MGADAHGVVPVQVVCPGCPDFRKTFSAKTETWYLFFCIAIFTGILTGFQKIDFAYPLNIAINSSGGA